MGKKLAVLLAVVGLALGWALGYGLHPEPPPPPPPPPAALVPPLAHAEVGEWLRLEQGGASDKFEVVGTDDTTVTVQVTSYQEGAPVATRTETWSRSGFSIPAGQGVLRSLSRERIDAGGRSWDCWRLDCVSRVRNIAIWISPELPVHGAVKIAAIGKEGPDEATAAHVVEYGFPGRPPVQVPQEHR